MAKPTFSERLMAKIRVDAETGCWMWMAAINAYGYGVIGLRKGKNLLAHRATYEMFVGPIPEGLDLDHLCRVRACANPEHLEPVTRRVNLLRGRGTTAANAAKTHCPQGHPYAGANLLIRSARKTRRCRTCDLARKAVDRANARAKRGGVPCGSSSERTAGADSGSGAG